MSLSTQAPAAPTAGDGLSERLRVVLVGVYDDPEVVVTAMDRLTGGANSETWSVRATRGDGSEERTVLRLPMGVRTTVRFATEAAALRCAAAAGVPEPRVLASDDDGAALGSPFLLMAFVDGETLPPRILREPRFAAVRERLAGQCGDVLARIHGVAVADVPGLQPVAPLPMLRELLDAFDDPQPALELGYRWLAANPPTPREPAIVHGDFRNGNLIVGDDGLRAVLDWEEVHLGDPLRDLGYLCARVWRFGGPGPVGGFGRREDLFAAYESAGGVTVDPADVRWWELWSTVRWGVGCLQMGARHLSGARRSVELAAIGRRAWEQEYDVALFLDELRSV